MQLSAVCMTIVCHVSDILSDAKVYKTIVMGLFKLEIYALLLDFGVLPVKNLCFHSNYVVELTRKDKRWNRAVMGNAVQPARSKMRWQGACPKCG